MVALIVVAILGGIAYFTLSEDAPVREPNATTTSATTAPVVTEDVKLEAWKTFVKGQECEEVAATSTMEALKFSQEGAMVKVATGTKVQMCAGIPVIY